MDKTMRASTWIKKNSTCPIVTEEAIQLLSRSIALYQLSSEETKQSYINQIKQNLKDSDLYAKTYTLAAKAFLKYHSL
jgi:hypothetical protein